VSEAGEPVASPAGGRFSSTRPRRWWMVLLIVSLAFNLLIGAAALTRLFIKERTERVTGSSYIQLVPRKFLSDLPQPRRHELLAIFQQHRDEFREGRRMARDSAARLADALAAEPYDAAKVKSVADEFANAGTGMIAQGVEAAMEVVGKLTPAERGQLAQRIRERAQSGRSK
jgi:uncharacterized membrane protein